MSKSEQAAAVAESYYDSEDADSFYAAIWGGEDIHIGLYEAPDEDIRKASRRTVAHMLELLPTLDESSRVLDLGAGYGGAARHIVAATGCAVTCLNISEVQNERNRARNAEAGLAERIRVLHGNFEALPEADASYDVVWSQDAFLHSSDRARTLGEAVRVLKPGGTLIFTDPMQADDCPPGVLQPILDRIHLASLASPAWYRSTLEGLGLEYLGFEELTGQLRTHYGQVRTALERHYPALGQRISREYFENMLRGLDYWTGGADRGWLAWGILRFRKR